MFLSPRGGFGQYLGRPTTFDQWNQRLGLDDRFTVILDLLRALQTGGLVEQVAEPPSEDDVAGYQLPASALLWVAGDGTRAFHDPIRVPNEPAAGGRTNSYFVNFYRTAANSLHGLEAREHTAQVPYEERLDREVRFREGRLPILYCSPTMELGVDIAELNVVNLAQHPTNTRQLCPAQRPSGPKRPARTGLCLLRHGQPPRSVFFQASRTNGGGRA